ncbi:MAG: McrC family protein [Gammaproteobacteria bacterium]
MAKILSCIEHETITISAASASDRKSIDESYVNRLVKFTSHMPPGALSWGHRSIKFSQFCGVIQLDDLTIEILPKVYGREHEPGASRHALVQMLRKSGFLISHKGSQAAINIQRHSVLDIFILHFCGELAALMTQGLLREYIGLEDNLNVIKGRLITEVQLKKNFHHKERLYCRYDELKEDILINRIIKYTLRVLFTLARSGETKRQVNELLMQFDSVGDTPVAKQDFSKLVFGRCNSRYQPIVEQCRMFISGCSPDVLAGRGSAVSLLFDMNRLFESWVAAILRPIAWRQGLKLRTQGPQKNLGYWLDSDQAVFQLRPDISLLAQDNSIEVIADAKWKILDESDKKLGISQSDLYQLQAYANRYGVHKLKLYYPKQSGLSTNKTLVMQGIHQASLEVVPLDMTNKYPINEISTE